MGEQSIRCLGADSKALRPQDRGATLFDIGVAHGLVSMCVRTDNAELIAALNALEGGRLLSHEGATAAAQILRQSPHRVMLSPLGRIEIFSSIPTAHGQSSNGPHTHLLPKLIASGRTHGANVPIPEGLQPALMLHPSSPWRDLLGKRTPFDAAQAKNFDRLLKAYGLSEDKHVHDDVAAAVRSGVAPADYSWPQSRRGRAQFAHHVAQTGAEWKLRDPAIMEDALRPWRRRRWRYCSCRAWLMRKSRSPYDCFQELLRAKQMTGLCVKPPSALKRIKSAVEKRGRPVAHLRK